jgi:hypothetical protein
MSWMQAADFEARYRREGDPWGYRDRPYERDKYARTLAACGAGPFAAALELGGSIGEFSALLAPRCRRLVSVDASPTAVAAARDRLAALPQAEPRLGTLPGDLPDGHYDLVVASEILYYLAPAALAATLIGLRPRMAAGATLVAVHYEPPGPERPFSAAAVHARLRGLSWLRSRRAERGPGYLLDVLERR